MAALAEDKKCNMDGVVFEVPISAIHGFRRALQVFGIDGTDVPSTNPALCVGYDSKSLVLQLRVMTAAVKLTVSSKDHKDNKGVKATAAPISKAALAVDPYALYAAFGVFSGLVNKNMNDDQLMQSVRISFSGSDMVLAAVCVQSVQSVQTMCGDPSDVDVGVDIHARVRLRMIPRKDDVGNDFPAPPLNHSEHNSEWLLMTLHKIKTQMCFVLRNPSFGMLFRGAMDDVDATKDVAYRCIDLVEILTAVAGPVSVGICGADYGHVLHMRAPHKNAAICYIVLGSVPKSYL